MHVSLSLGLRRWFPYLTGDFICDVGHRLSAVVLASVLTPLTPHRFCEEVLADRSDMRWRRDGGV